MQKVIHLFIFVFVLMYCKHDATAQCSGGTSGGYIYPSTVWKSVNTNPINGSSYRTFPAIAGATYYFSFCTADGGSSTYDTHIMLQNNAGAAIGISNDDFCGFRSYLTWNCTTTAFYRVLVTKFFCTAQSNMGIMVYKSSINGPLPIDLISFTAKIKTANAVLNWTTASETNSDYFSVEKRDKVSNEFISIGKVKAKGIASNISNYSYIDYNTHKGVNYYRLNMVDINGSSEYSDIVETNDDEFQKFYSLYVNQNERKLHFTFYSDVPQLAHVTIYNMNGKQVSTFNFNLESGEQLFTHDTHNYTPNMYVVKIQSDWNGVYWEKIIVTDN